MASLDTALSLSLSTEAWMKGIGACGGSESLSSGDGLVDSKE